MSILEKKNELDKIFKVLKSEFIGLDSILDEIKISISPWYLTPEILNKPTVVSLWGMTGTGKTSVVKRLIELLGYKDRSLILDSGLEAEDASGSSNLSDSILDKLGAEELCTETDNSFDIFKNFIFVFDEFQYARTINEGGIELMKSPLRPLWTLIDTGYISVTQGKFEIARLFNFVDSLNLYLNNTNDDFEVKEGNFANIESFDKVYNYSIVNSRLYNSYKDIPVPLNKNSNNNEEYEYEDEEDEKKIPIIETYYLVEALKKLNIMESGLSSKILNEYLNCTKLSEIIKLLLSYKKDMISPKELDCSKSLIFILGNLDEAFGVEGDLNPDYEADIFKDITSKVTISDIKNALQKRFRAEQIARFGNNIIKYPTLSKNEFIQIINKELNRIFLEFNNNAGIKVNVTEEVIQLLYSEGVYPVQGVRPVFTTIGTLITPILSDIIINRDTEDDNEVTISIKNLEDFIEKKFKISKTTLVITYEKTKKYFEKTINLQLGSLRCPTTKKTRFINSVHEAGHAIIFMYLTGEYPINIVSVSTDNGGFCDVYSAEKVKEIPTKEDVDINVMVSLGGYLAEKLVFKDSPEKCLMGSRSDLLSAWHELSSAIHETGYLLPMFMSNYEIELNTTNIPLGLDVNKISTNIGDINDTVGNGIKYIYYDLMKKTSNILESESTLLKELSLYLGENGSINKNKIIELADKFGKELTSEKMKEKRELNKDFYYNVLSKFN